MNRHARTAVVIALALVAIAALIALSGGARNSGQSGGGREQGGRAAGQAGDENGDGSGERDLSALIARLNRNPGSIDRVVFDPPQREIDAQLSSGRTLTAFYANNQAQISFQKLLQEKDVDFAAKPADTGGFPWGSLLIWFVPLLLLGAFWFFMMRRSQAGGQQMLQMARSKAKRVQPDTPKVGFKDVAGAEETVQELEEIKEFLADPTRFRALGASIPKGVLLHGPPGTGKTLLARAVAGEAGVPFFSVSGSDFVEMFVGVGASRVRDLFQKAKETAPCIVFVDEIDAVGRQRGAGLGGGHDEREQTLNQLLVEMDGFEPNENVIVMAATNRLDILDPALLRPGRFDRRIVVDMPDRQGRRDILGVHSRGKPLAADADLDALAAATPGFTGADLANLVNEGALLAARRRLVTIGPRELDEAVLRVLAGPEKRARKLTEAERKVTAYHELGHAFVGHFLEDADEVHKISIVSRGRSLGLTMSLPVEERFLLPRSALVDRLAMTLGGRTAEELVFGQVTTGAADDLQKVTELANQMVTKFGMSENFAPRALGRQQDGPFVGLAQGSAPPYSDATAREIDEEVRRIVTDAHERALQVLRDHEDDLHRIAVVLMDRETIEKDEFERLLAGERPEEIYGDDLAGPPERGKAVPPGDGEPASPELQPSPSHMEAAQRPGESRRLSRDS